MQAPRQVQVPGSDRSGHSEGSEWFERQLAFANRHYRFTDCPYYPCHALPEGQDGLNCLLCYCPFYPCGVEARGGKWLDTPDGKVWDCTGCNFVHADGTVETILKLFYEGKNADEINDKLTDNRGS